MGHSRSTKGQSGKMEKNKYIYIYICQEKPKAKPPLNRKGNKRLRKKKTNGVQSQRNEFPIFNTF